MGVNRCGGLKVRKNKLCIIKQNENIKECKYTYMKLIPAAAIIIIATIKPMTIPAMTPGSIDGPGETFFPTEVGVNVGAKDITVFTRIKSLSGK